MLTEHVSAALSFKANANAHYILIKTSAKEPLRKVAYHARMI